MMLWSIRSVSIYICMSTETISNSITIFLTPGPVNNIQVDDISSISESDLGTS